MLLLRQAAALPPDAAAAELARLRALLLRLAAASDALRWADLAGVQTRRAVAASRPFLCPRFCAPRTPDAGRAPAADALLPPPSAPRGGPAAAFALGVLRAAADGRVLALPHHEPTQDG